MFNSLNTYDSQKELLSFFFMIHYIQQIYQLKDAMLNMIKILTLCCYYY